MNEDRHQVRDPRSPESIAKPSEDGISPQGIISIERLSHFQCAACNGWWSIGDAPKRVEWWCPWCGLRQLFHAG